MTAATTPAQQTPRPVLSRLFWVGPLAIVAATLANVVLQQLAVAVLRPDPAFLPLTLMPPIIFTVIGVLGAVLAGLFCIAGHMYPMFFGFKGGKGIAPGFGAAVGLSPYMLVLAPILVAVVWRWRYVSLGSIVAAGVTGPILLLLAILDLAPWSYLLFGVIGAPLVLWRHRANIERIRAGTEPKLRASV